MTESILENPARHYEQLATTSGSQKALEVIYDAMGGSLAVGGGHSHIGASREMVTRLVEDDVSGLRVTASRGDWLFGESRVIGFLNRLLWLFPLQDEVSPGNGTRWASLVDACSRWMPQVDLDGVLPPAGPRLQADIVALAAYEAIEQMAQRDPDLEVADYQRHRLRWMKENPGVLPGGRDVPTLEGALARVHKGLAEMPGAMSVLLAGSFASSWRDRYSDLDIYCFCEDLPTDAERDALLQRLEVQPSFRSGLFEHIGMDDADVHLLFIPIEDQRRLLASVHRDGDITVARDWQSTGYAPAPYVLVTGRVLSDPTGVLVEVRSQAQLYPDALRRTEAAQARSDWAFGLSQMKLARTTGDELRAYTALHFSTEALVRLVFAMHGVHVDPCEPKWVPAYISNLEQPVRGKVEFVLDGVCREGTIQERFDRVVCAWERQSSD